MASTSNYAVCTRFHSIVSQHPVQSHQTLQKGLGTRLSRSNVGEVKFNKVVWIYSLCGISLLFTNTVAFSTQSILSSVVVGW